ncbi:MAG: hypothetical protein PHP28_11250 [Actinomycetota bacterium]|nr:hypothetical protein [Actinomycetota bacterium]MDD5667406.1 hypothetical protein [Actinomycetota bacterium]
MRKAVVVIIITALSLSMLAFVAGCGGDANKDDAKEFMTAGDKYMSDAKLKGEELENLQTELGSAAISGDMSAISGEAGQAMQEEVDGILDGIDSDLEAAKAEYEKILALEGVQDYKDYASKRIEAVEAYTEQQVNIRQLVGSLIDALAAMAQGQDIDIISMFMESEEYEKIEEYGSLGDKLVKEADQIKLDKKLES